MKKTDYTIMQAAFKFCGSKQDETQQVIPVLVKC
jgi:hypothetical protein